MVLWLSPRCDFQCLSIKRNDQSKHVSIFFFSIYSATCFDPSKNHHNAFIKKNCILKTHSGHYAIHFIMRPHTRVDTLTFNIQFLCESMTKILFGIETCRWKIRLIFWVLLNDNSDTDIAISGSDPWPTIMYSRILNRDMHLGCNSLLMGRELPGHNTRTRWFKWGNK